MLTKPQILTSAKGFSESTTNINTTTNQNAKDLRPLTAPHRVVRKGSRPTTANYLNKNFLSKTGSIKFQ